MLARSPLRRCLYSGRSPLPRQVVWVALLGLGVSLTASVAETKEVGRPDAQAKYRDASLPVIDRVSDLLGRMTLDEKVAQLCCLWGEKAELLDATGRFDPNRAAARLGGGIGQIARPGDRSGEAGASAGVEATRGARETAELVNAIQKWVAENTRLGIPVLFHGEGLHGFQANEATHFPQAIGLAGTWDPALLERCFRVVGREIRARGVAIVLAPVVDVGREPRWGRIEETYGEDPYLVSEMGLAAVRGFQGTDLPLGKEHVFATLKHMTGHGQPEAGQNVGPANISERELRDTFLPPFRRAVTETNVMAVMPSYNEVDGVPSHANGWLLDRVLRREWGFRGLVISDYDAIPELERRHHVAATADDAAVTALAAGVDMDMPKLASYARLAALVRSKRVSEAAIDRAVARVLRTKFLAGLFEDPYADPAYAERVTSNDESRAVALEAARKAVTLLKNDGLLPIEDLGKPGGPRRIAVIGPNAAEVMLGGYSDTPKHQVSVLDGVRAKLAGKAEVTYAEGCRLTASRNWFGDEVKPISEEENKPRLEAASRVAAAADLVVLVVGDNEQTSREAWAENHLGDRSGLRLFGQQEELVERVCAAAKPTVVVMLHGRPLAIGDVVEGANAVLEGWYLGQEGGTAVAEALVGELNPGGKLPITIPRSVGQLPVFYNHKPTARRGYAFSDKSPLFPFGFGLSYTEFRLGPPRLSTSTTSLAEPVTVSVEVANTGPRDGDEVVQLYIRDRVSSVTRPVKELKAFRRVTLAAGAKTTVTFELNEQSLAFHDLAERLVVEPGEFDVMTGPNSVELQSATLTVSGPLRQIDVHAKLAAAR
ncbi:MAG: glycoside hydrolase family 3 N-terminal domain-containing protein [Lacipirellulaceae bacterium]